MIYQAQEKGCGYAAIKNLLALNGFPRAEALEEPSIAEKAPSLGELIAYASEFGLTLSGYKFLEPSGLATTDAFPLLCVLEEGERSHLVLVKRGRGERYLGCDQAKARGGKRKGSCLESSEASTSSSSPTSLKKRKHPTCRASRSRLSPMFCPFSPSWRHQSPSSRSLSSQAKATSSCFCCSWPPIVCSSSRARFS